MEPDTKEIEKEQMLKMKASLESKKHKDLWIRMQAFYDHQKLRLAQENRLRMYGKLGMDVSDVEWYPKKLKELEEEFYKGIEFFVRQEPLWGIFLSKVKGIGPIMAGGLIAWFDDPAKASSPSSMWKYAGLAVIDGQPDRRRQGETLTHSPKLKVHMWKIGKQLLFAKGSYYRYYLDQKEFAATKHPTLTDVSEYNQKQKTAYYKAHPEEWPDGKIHMYAYRKMIKLFLANMWEAWRESYGLETPKPYAEAILGHKDIIHYREMMDKKVEVIKAK